MARRHDTMAQAHHAPPGPTTQSAGSEHGRRWPTQAREALRLAEAKTRPDRGTAGNRRGPRGARGRAPGTASDGGPARPRARRPAGPGGPGRRPDRHLRRRRRPGLARPARRGWQRRRRCDSFAFVLNVRGRARPGTATRSLPCWPTFDKPADAVEGAPRRTPSAARSCTSSAGSTRRWPITGSRCRRCAGPVTTCYGSSGCSPTGVLVYGQRREFAAAYADLTPQSPQRRTWSQPPRPGPHPRLQPAEPGLGERPAGRRTEARWPTSTRPSSGCARCTPSSAGCCGTAASCCSRWGWPAKPGRRGQAVAEYARGRRDMKLPQARLVLAEAARSTTTPPRRCRMPGGPPGSSSASSGRSGPRSPGSWCCAGDARTRPGPTSPLGRRGDGDAVRRTLAGARARRRILTATLLRRRGARRGRRAPARGGPAAAHGPAMLRARGWYAEALARARRG